MFTKRSLMLKTYSRRVFLMKHSLPVVAFLFAALIFIWPIIKEQKEVLIFTKPNTDVKNASVDMEEVRYVAQDDKNQPLILLAENVWESDAENKIITLEEPKAKYTLNSGEILHSACDSGKIFQQKKFLFFDTPVDSWTESGWKAKSVNVTYDYTKETLESPSAVTVNGPDGKMTADGFLIKNKGNELFFKQNVDTTIFYKNSPIRITATNGAVINQLKQTIDFDKNVHVYHQGKEIQTDHLIIYYDQKNKEDKLKQMEAIGSVVGITDNEKITGDTGLYNHKTGDLKMTGSVKLFQGNSVLTGDTATYNMNTKKTSLTSDKRVKGKLIPADFEK